MAAKKKAKAKTKVKRKQTPATRPALRRKAAPVRKKTAAKKPAAKKKPAARRAAPKKKTPARRAAPKKKPAARPSPRPRPVQIPAQPAAAPSAPPAPLTGEERVGTVTHYYGHLSVAAVRLDSGSLRVGDRIRVLGHTSDFRQWVESIQIEHQSVSEASAGQEIGLGVTEHARENDIVYKVTA